jgi:predicted phosphodiesterase
MTHGHLHHVKSGCYSIIGAGREAGAKAVLFGHTHEALCLQREDGIWILNPGSCGSFGGNVGLITVTGQEISECRILRYSDLEEYNDLSC